LDLWLEFLWFLSLPGFPRKTVSLVSVQLPPRVPVSPSNLPSSPGAAVNLESQHFVHLPEFEVYNYGLESLVVQ
jgi:hypothetical protein